ncbi:MAG: hypothetical protein NC405_07170 [Odoribacter sp.]|nr:hypothetical protein [Odoribacter sp.]
MTETYPRKDSGGVILVLVVSIAVMVAGALITSVAGRIVEREGGVGRREA